MFLWVIDSAVAKKQNRGYFLTILNSRKTSTEGAAALLYFPPTVDQKWLENELSENIKKNSYPRVRGSSSLT